MARYFAFPRAAVFIILLALNGPLFAKTYYIDAKLGNDGFSGETPEQLSGNDGPWRTFANLAPRNRLLPGDNVLLRCGQKWPETLKLRSSGTAEAPIRVSSYPAGCVDKPAIDGLKAIPRTAWSLHKGSIYKTRLPVDLIINGNFDNSINGWRKWSLGNDANMAIDSLCPSSTSACLAFNSGGKGSSLLISNAFAIEAGVRYQISFSIRAPSGLKYGAYVRRFSAPWDTLGLAESSMSGNGVWQEVNRKFTATESLDNARFDLQIDRAGALVHIKNVRVTRDEIIPEVLVSVTDTGRPENVAHHPERGFNPLAPDSLYLTTATNSATITRPDGRKGSEYLVTGSDLVLPPHATIKAGDRVVLRSQAWSLFEHTISAISGNRLYLEPATSYPLQFPGWGYYLTGALWMLDAPGEWHYDAASQTLYVWPRNSDHPGDRFAYSTLDRGLDIGLDVYVNKHIVIDNLVFRNLRDGLYVQRAENIALRRLEIENAARHGIDGEGTVKLELSNSRIVNTGTDAVFGPASKGSLIVDNDILNSGVVLDGNGKPDNLPLPNYGAIHTGRDAQVSGNRLRNLAFIGISTGSNSLVSGNAVTGYCYLLSDCAAIYLGGVSSVTVTGNLVTQGYGNRSGTPSALNTLVDSLYLDGGSNNVNVVGNTLTGGDYAVQLHNGHDNRIERNTLYGSRANLVWLQETGSDLRPSGNIFGNVIQENSLFSTTGASALRHVAKVENAADFATYRGNIHSAFVSPVIAVENTPTSGRSYQFKDWQAATDANGVPRRLDYDGAIGAPLAGFARGLLGGTLIVNGGLSDGTVGWSRYNAVPPSATLTTESCLPLATRCLLLSAGGSNTSLSSPRFDVTQGQWYRVSFDAQVGESGQNLKIQAIQSGPASYASVMGSEPLIFSGSTTLKRYSFVFQSTATVQRSSTSAGVRVDFMDVKPGQTLRLADFEVVPLTLASSGSVSHALFANPERTTLDFACPNAASAAGQCGNYYRFPQGDRVGWPIRLGPLEAQVVFFQDASLRDSDEDGIADSQDACAGTPAGNPTNAKGCALGQ